MMQSTISTGSKSIDALLGGGIRTGFVTDVYGQSGSGKSQLCFTLAVNCVKSGGQAVFVDTAGTFRPERISEIAGSESVLEKIVFIRTMTVQDQLSAIKKMQDIDARLVVVDSLTFNFSNEFTGPARHLAVMSYLHELALLAINSDCAVVVTNMVRSIPSEQETKQREYLGNTVSINSHIKLRLEIHDPAVSSFRAWLVKPPGQMTEFTITSRGIEDKS